MAQTLSAYLSVIKDTLCSALDLRSFPSQVVEKQNRPLIEVQDSPELMLNSIVIARTDQEKCLIESSINSVRVSFTIKKPKEIEKLLTHLFERFISLRADKFSIIRRKPVDGYDFSFLVTNRHMETMHREHVINFILTFILDIEKEITEMKIAINTQMRIAATYFIDAVSS
ncbi:MAG: actin-related protein 2/3 complex subunit 4 family protein [Candidatus Pacebacteria bacterium]|nr:actin-related protein 2/3 complex subunit 4 family protein [Candidatus Paceibacterota bacterium]